jgi:hypothetical protein
VLGHSGSEHTARLAEALRAGGAEPVVLTARPLRIPEGVLRRRGFERPLSHVPRLLAELVRGDFDVVHALSPADAAAARGWRRVRGGPVVFTCVKPPDRESVSNRRLTLRLLAAAVEDSDAVLAADEAVRSAMSRWLAVDAPVLEPAAHVSLYRDLLDR